MKVARTIAGTRKFCQAAARPLVLVPTMGALHAGHAALIGRARKAAGRQGTVVVSIFVNPSQFGPNEDFARYPRPFAADRQVCQRHGADLLFQPSPQEMYPSGFSTWVEETAASQFLCGGSRPGHFRGVCTVVLKLFQITACSHAVFGLKDFQQCTVIARMVRDLNLPVRLELAQTVREPDGLALSSRNAYLSREERAAAPVLRRALLNARSAFRAGERNPAVLRKAIARQIRAEAPAARLDYLELADAVTLEPLREMRSRAVIALAVFFGQTRLIDNLTLPQ